MKSESDKIMNLISVGEKNRIKSEQIAKEMGYQDEPTHSYVRNKIRQAEKDTGTQLVSKPGKNGGYWKPENSSEKQKYDKSMQSREKEIEKRRKANTK